MGDEKPVSIEVLHANYMAEVDRILQTEEISSEEALKLARAYEEHRLRRTEQMMRSSDRPELVERISKPYDIGEVLDRSSPLPPEEQRRRVEIAVNQIGGGIAERLLDSGSGPEFVEVMEEKKAKLLARLLETLELEETQAA